MTTLARISAAKDSIAAIKSTYKGIDGIFLPAHIVGYIASICKATYYNAKYDAKCNPQLLLNLYKAFESIQEDEDPLADYKNMIQNYIFGFAISPEFRFDETDYGLTRREYMYVFDITSCVPADIIYGVEPKNSQRKWIDDELADCSHFVQYFGMRQGIRFGYSDALDKMLYKHTRLLEEALRTKSYGLVNYMSHKQMIYPDMLSYIYIKHNHERFAPSEDYLSNNELWFNLLCEYSMLDVVLGAAISGIREHIVYSLNGLHNVVRPNLAMVKKIVPHYIQAGDEAQIYPYTFENVNNYEYWQKCYQMEVEVHWLGDEVKKFNVEGNREIGEYLQKCL
jgi:hypothetical protein